jgi:hypothetical protein
MTYDESGNVVPDSGLDGLGQTSDQFSFGSALWEMFHPGQVQAEAAATGQPIPTTGDVLSEAASQAAGAAQETASNIGSQISGAASGIAASAEQIGKLLIGGLIAVAVLAVLNRFPKR